MTCDHCPCPETCVRLPYWCRMVAQYPDVAGLIEEACRDHRGGTSGSPRPPVAETLPLVRQMKACLFRSTPPGCCSGGRCGLRRGARVSHLDCFACLRQYDPPD